MLNYLIARICIPQRLDVRRVAIFSPVEKAIVETNELVSLILWYR